MSSFIKKNLDDLWVRTLKAIDDSGYIDKTVSTYIHDSSLYDINDEYATIVVPFKLHKQFMENNIGIIQQKLAMETGIPDIACQIILNSELASIESGNMTKPINPIVLEDKILKDYTFENFVVGQSNREAHAAALSCAYEPGKFYNPLFIYGNSGLGKTHLLHAIGNYVKSTKPDKKVLYIYSEDFVTLVINAIKNKTIEAVKERICEVDILLIDDIQRLAQWGGSQEIFFNLYNKLVNNKKQVVITSDIHPSELKSIETRLISRFSSGLTVSVDSPEFETALAILQKKIEGREDHIIFEDDVLKYIATKFSSDVRSLEGALNELVFKSILYNPEKIDMQFLNEMFKDNPNINKKEELSVSKIKRAVCEFYGLTKQQIESKSRTANIANARHIAVFLCRKHLEMPFAKIGLEFGNRDHSTIMSSYEKISKIIKEKDTFKQAVSKIEKNLGV